MQVAQRTKLHPALAVCHNCNKVMPHDALVCRCGWLAMPAWEKARPVTDARIMRVRLEYLAKGIGWECADAGRVALARCMHLALFVTQAGTMAIEVLDECLGTVYEATARCTMAQAQQMAAAAAIQHVHATYGPEERSQKPPIRPDPEALHRKLERLKANVPKGRKVQLDKVNLLIDRYRKRNGIHQPRRIRRTERAVPDPDRTWPLQGNTVPWQRMRLEDCYTLDMGDLPAQHVSQAVRDLRQRRNRWKAGDASRRGRNFIIWREQHTIYVHRTA